MHVCSKRLLLCHVGLMLLGLLPCHVRLLLLGVMNGVRILLCHVSMLPHVGRGMDVMLHPMGHSVRLLMGAVEPHMRSMSTMDTMYGGSQWRCVGLLLRHMCCVGRLLRHMRCVGLLWMHMMSSLGHSGLNVLRVHGAFV